MSLVKVNLTLLLSFFPVFILRSNLNNSDFLITLLISLLIILSSIFIYLKLIRNNKIYTNLFLSIIIIIGIDNNLGLWNGIIQPNNELIWGIFKNLYFPVLIFFLLLICLIFFLFIFFSQLKTINFFLTFLIAIFLFNIFDDTKSYKEIYNYETKPNSTIHGKEVIIIFDEMSGFNSLSSTTIEGKKFNENFKTLLNKYEFEVYTNSSSLFDFTNLSIPSLLNFTNNTKKNFEYISKSNNYFTNFELNKNLLFDKYKNISVFQNMYIDYCKNVNVIKCQSYNPFKIQGHLRGFKHDYLSRIISIWKLNGSIVSNFIWKIMREYGIIDSILSPEGEKITFDHLFRQIETDIKKEIYDLIFIHTLVPHRPYGFNKTCNYDGKLALKNNYFSEEQHIKQHNIERECVIFYFEKFLNNLKKDDLLDNVALTILSDHGSRINSNINTRNSSFLARRYKGSIYKEINKPLTTNEIFITIFNSNK